MRKVTLEELKQLALNSREALWQAAHRLGRDIKLYLHWSAGHYGQFFEDYHINIDQDGSIYVSTEDLSTVLAHTWQRNSGSMGIALACCAGATTNDLGQEPPTSEQLEAMAQVIEVLCQAFGLTIDGDSVMTHAEVADLDGYGPATTCERWDLWFLPDTPKGFGGDILRGKAIWYQNNQ